MSSALDDYDETTSQCKVCKKMVIKKTNDASKKSYMVNGDESYHQVYANNNKVCVKDKAEQEYAEKHGSLEGFGTPPAKSSQASPSRDPKEGPKSPDTIPKEVMINAGWWENNWTQAKRIADSFPTINKGEYGLTPSEQKMVRGMAIMHDFASLEIARSLKKAMGVK